MLKNISTHILFGTIFLASTSSVTAVPLSMSLEDVIAAALKHNLNLQVARLTPEIDKNAVIAEKSVFDPVFTVGSSGSRRVVDYGTTDTETTGYSLDGGAEMKLPYGTNIDLTLTHRDDEVESGSANGDGSSTSATLVISQPLLRNKGTVVNTRTVQLAENSYQVSQLSLKQTIIDTVAEAKSFYWQYYFSLVSLRVQRESLGLARRFLEEMEEKIRIGSAPRLELIHSQAEVASREENVISAENNVYNAQDNLLNFIYGKITSSEPLVITDEPSSEKIEVDEERLIKVALMKRTEYLTSEYQLESTETDLLFFDNQALPQVDISATIVANDGQGDSAIATLSTDDYRDYQYGLLSLSVELPLGKRRDKANRASAILKKRQATTAREQTKSGIILEVRTASRDINSAFKRKQATEIASKYAAESLATEQEKFANGLSTSYQLLLFQRDLTDARTSEVEATVNYQTAMITLNKATGTTLEKNNINLDEARR